MHRLEALAVQGMANEASRVERRVLERSDGRSVPVVGMRPPWQTPSAWRKNGGRRRGSMFEAAMAIESERERQRPLAPPNGVVQDHCAVAASRARPGPVGECALERLAAGVLVEITSAAPAHAGLLHFDRDMSPRDKRPPPMPPLLFEDEGGRADRFGADLDTPLNAARNGRSKFVDVDPQSAAIPGQ